MFSIYPNPNNGSFVITSAEAGDLQLLNELGQVVHTMKVSGIEDEVVKVENLSVGIYFITGRLGDQNISQKIIVSR